MMMKRKIKPYQTRLLYTSLLLILVAISIVLFLLNVPNQAELELTAESLLASPLELPEYIHVIEPLPGSIIARQETICLTVFPNVVDTELDANDAYHYTTIWLDGYRQSNLEFTHVDALTETTSEIWTGVYFVCLNTTLDSGIHLFGLSITSPQGNDTHYQWAYRVE